MNRVAVAHYTPCPVRVAISLKSISLNALKVAYYTVSKNKRNQLTAAQLQALPISIGEARKLLGGDAQDMSDNEVAWQVLSLNELAILLCNNIDLHKSPL